MSYNSASGQPSVITDAKGNTICYRYDARGRKVAEWGTAVQPAVFSYDDIDRMTTLTTFRANTETITTDPSERTDGDTTTWSYHDATGLETRKTYADGSHQDKTYDSYNRLSTETDARGNVKNMGRRATKQITENGNVTLKQRYIYRGYLQIACCDLTRANHPCLWLITWDPTQPVATRPLAIQKSGTWYCYGWDQTKNICEVFGSNGYINTTYTYTPYGEVSESGDVTQPIQWSGEYHDSELELVYFNYRYYNSYSARWISRDPLAETAGLNLYKYTTSPYKVVDVLGSSLVDIAKSVAPHIEGSISGSFTTVFPIAPPAVTVNTTISISGSGRQCCDKATFSITASTGFVVGARAEAHVSVSGTLSFIVDFSS